MNSDPQKTEGIDQFIVRLVLVEKRRAKWLLCTEEEVYEMFYNISFSLFLCKGGIFKEPRIPWDFMAFPPRKSSII
jgi:hypothetical protein